MSHLVIPRPQPGDYAPYSAAYIGAVPDGDVVRMLEEQSEDVLGLVRAFGEAGGAVRYAPGKWSVKEVVGHVADAERVFAYRALRFARADATPLPGFDEDAYVAAAGFDRRALSDLAEEFAAVRAATVRLFAGLDAAALERSGTASGFRVTVGALAWVIAGHERHHARLLRERYLPLLR
jgi:hypothetical protein